MQKYLKFLRSLPPEQRKLVVEVWQHILNNELEELKAKKLKGFENYYSIRIGKIRLVFAKEAKTNKIINIDYRKNIYKGL